MMKRTKNFVAVATALTMALSVMAVPSMAVSASDLSTVSDNTISGDVNYVNTTVYQVTLPTTTGMEFALDPQGLTSLDQGSYNAGDAGKIVSATKMTATNESSVPLNLTSKFYVEDSTGTLTLVDANGTVDNSKQQMQLFIQTDGNGSDASYSNAVAVTALSSTAPTDYTVSMNAATYTFGKTGSEYTYTLSAGTGSKLNMKIAGSVAKDYDWSAYTGDDAATVKLHAVFKFEDANATTGSAGSGSAEVAYGYFNPTADFVWFDLSETANGGITDSAKLSSVTVTAPGGSATAVTATVVDNWGKITWTDMRDAGISWVSNGTYVVSFSYDGENYAANVVAPNL